MKTDTRQMLDIMRDCLRTQRLSIALAALGMVGVVIGELLAPWPLKVILDHVLLATPLTAKLGWLQPLLDQGRAVSLGAMSLAIFVIALLIGAFSYLQIYLSARVGNFVVYRLRGVLFGRLQNLSLTFHQNTRTGELLTKVASDTNLLRDMFADWMLTFAARVVTVVAMLGVMYFINVKLALLVTATLPPLLFVLYRLNQRIKDSVKQQRKHEGRMASRLNETLSSIALVQAFGRQDAEQARFESEIAGNLESGIRSARNTAAVTKAIALISAAGTALTVLFGAWQVLEGRLTPGELLIFIAYVNALYKPVRDLGKLSAKFSRASVSFARIAEIVALEPDIQDAPDAIIARDLSGEIVFENVSFGYHPGRLVLDNLSLRVRAGERIALVGPSGAGKSTLLSLMLRLYEPQSGRILIDGIDIRRYHHASLRHAMGIVLQDTVLFGVSIAENIAYGMPEATRDEIEAAAKLARAHEFIVDLPDGYDTLLSERGVTLSGGQRQRICLARALIKRPAILMMDEPTSAIDTQSARRIDDAVRQAQQGRTTIVISHQLQDMESYDRIFVLDQGRLVESGAHETLLKARGTYLSLVEHHHA